MQAPGQTLSDVAKELQDELRKTVIRPDYQKALDSAGNTKTDIETVVSEAERLLERPLSDFAPETAPSLVRKIAALRRPLKMAHSCLVQMVGQLKSRQWQRWASLTTFARPSTTPLRMQKLASANCLLRLRQI
jgi:hypothetical protein